MDRISFDSPLTWVRRKDLLAIVLRASAVMTMEITRSLCCKELKSHDVVDSTGETVGNIGDLTFTFDGQLRLSQFILAGQKLEEFLEAIKVRPDKDPVFNASLIKKIDDKVYLNASVNGLKTTLDEDAIPAGEIRLSKLEKMDIFDKDNVKVGRTIDVDFDVDGSASIIVGGSFIEEKLEAVGLKADVDIIVPGDVIDSLTDVMKLKVSKSVLGTTMEEALKATAPKIIKARAAKDIHRDISKVRLFGLKPK